MKKKAKKNKQEQKYFDDCPICRAQKQADKEGRLITEFELKDSFDKAKKVKGAVVGNFSDQNDSSIN